MSIPRKFIGLCFEVQFDLALGLLSLYAWSSLLLDRVPTLWEYLIAMGFAKLPDLDVLIQVIKKEKITGAHHDYLHYPLISIPLVALVTFVFGSWFWALVAGTAMFAHYLHDSIEMGPGIPWFAPFDWKTNYHLRARTGELPFARSPEDLVFQKSITLDEWLEKEYLRVTPASVSGVVFFLTMLALVLIDHFLHSRWLNWILNVPSQTWRHFSY